MAEIVVPRTSPLANASLTGLVAPNSAVVPVTAQLSPSRIASLRSGLASSADSVLARLPGIDPLTPTNGRSTLPAVVSVPLNGNGNGAFPLFSSVQPAISSIADTPLSGVVQVAPESDVQSLLASRGYIATDTIVSSNRGQSEARYIRAVNPQGNNVYIELDRDGVVAVDPTQMVSIESSGATIITEAAKNSLSQCAMGDASGVAVECHNGVCIMGVGDPQNSHTTVFTKVSEPTTAAAVTSRSPLALPVVTLSSIIANQPQVDAGIQAATTRLQTVGYTTYQAKLDDMQRALNELQAQLNAYRQQVATTYVELQRTKTELSRVLGTYSGGAPLTEVDRTNIGTIVTNINARQDLTSDLLAQGDVVSGLRSNVTEISQGLADLTKFNSGKFSGIGQLLG